MKFLWYRTNGSAVEIQSMRKTQSENHDCKAQLLPDDPSSVSLSCTPAGFHPVSWFIMLSYINIHQLSHTKLSSLILNWLEKNGSLQRNSPGTTLHMADILLSLGAKGAQPGLKGNLCRKNQKKIMPNSPLEKYTVHSGTCHQGSLPEIFRNAKIAQRTMGLRQIKDSPSMLPRLEGWIVGTCCYIATGMFEILYLGNIPKLVAAIFTCFKSHIGKTPQKLKHLYPTFWMTYCRYCTYVPGETKLWVWAETLKSIENQVCIQHSCAPFPFFRFLQSVAALTT